MRRKFTKYPKTSIKANSGPLYDRKSNYSRYVVRVYKSEEDIAFSDYDKARQYAISKYDRMGVDRVQILDALDDNALLDEWVNEPEEVE